MGIKITWTVDDGETIAKLLGLKPERFLRAWAVVIKNLAKRGAQRAAAESGGRSFWQREVVASVHSEVAGNVATAYSDSIIAAHAHTGGVIRPRHRKYLAIPLDRKLRNTGPEDLPWRTEDHKPVFLRRRRGPGWVMGDYAGRGKNKQFTPRFALVPQTAPQKPRPWWPDDNAVELETLRFFNEDFEP